MQSETVEQTQSDGPAHGAAQESAATESPIPIHPHLHATLNLTLHGSFLRQELSGVDKAPKDVFQRLVPIADGLEVAPAGGSFLGRGLACQGALVKSCDYVLVRGALLQRLRKERFARGSNVGMD